MKQLAFWILVLAVALLPLTLAMPMALPLAVVPVASTAPAT